MLRHKLTASLLVAAAALLAAALASQGVFLVQSQPQLTSAYVAEALPITDPKAPAWDRIVPIEVPLVAQASAPPFLPQVSVPTLMVRSINNGQWIAFLLEWKDVTRNASATRPDEFRDAAAIQLPVRTDTPGVCMGVRGQPVNLWHWKADWQEDIDKGFRDVTDAYPNFFKDYYPFASGQPPFKIAQDFAGPDALAYMTGRAAGNPLSEVVRRSPIEELRAEGFGSATHWGRQEIAGRGVWADGRWRVVFARPMATGNPDAVQFAPGGSAFAAFAVWNGANGEVGSKKQLSADVLMAIEAPSPLAAAATHWSQWWPAFAALVALALVAIALTAFVARRSRAKGSGTP